MTMAESKTRAEAAHNLRAEMMEEEEEKNMHQEDRAGVPSAGYTVRSNRSRLPLICSFIAVVIVLAGITVLTVWLVYRPRKPKFSVVSAAVYELNATSSPFMSTAMQFTVVIRNPNKRLSIFYDQFSAFVSYKNQAITPQVTLPPLFQEPKSTVALSPVLGGAQVPVAAEVVGALSMDEAYGVVGLSLVLTGKLEYNAGTIIKSTGHYRVYVRCDFFVGLKKGFSRPMPLIGSNYLLCRVDV
ncbi:NDR1/HIN1-like protein 12 [Primulina eburnea]|uniref:NDR1/HIN1-like protein 12 n=1 Tax=Primulina eburnea TaxID=1245227 RepID=UPI003C6C2BD3